MKDRERESGEALISGYENEKRTNHCEPSDHLLPYWYGDGQRGKLMQKHQQAPLGLAFVHTIWLTSQYHEMNLFGKDFLNNIISALQIFAAFLFRAYKN